MSNFKNNWLELVRRFPGFFSLLFLGLILIFSVGSSLLCKINYNAGILKGVKIIESRTIACEGYVVDWSGPKYHIYESITFFNDPGQELMFTLPDTDPMGRREELHFMISQIDMIVMSNFKYPDWQMVESNKAAIKIEAELDAEAVRQVYDKCYKINEISHSRSNK